ncbi:PTS sugar transporter subunit IIA [Mesorhizobium sp.]
MSPILLEEDISLDLVTKGKQSALSKIAIRIARRSGLDEKVVLRSLFDRERLASTGIGRGVAIPHALLENISSPVASLTRLAPPVDFEVPTTTQSISFTRSFGRAQPLPPSSLPFREYAGCFGHLRFGSGSALHNPQMRR